VPRTVGRAAKVLSPPGCVDVSTRKSTRLKSYVEYRCAQFAMLRNTHQPLRIEKSPIHVAPPSSNSADEYFDPRARVGNHPGLSGKTIIEYAFHPFVDILSVTYSQNQNIFTSQLQDDSVVSNPQLPVAFQRSS